MKVLHVAPWNQRCGIAGYTESVVKHLALEGVESEVFPIELSGSRYMPAGEFLQQLDRCVRMTADCDVVHVQHEFGMFAGPGGMEESISHFAHLLAGLKATGRPVVVTFHTLPEFARWYAGQGQLAGDLSAGGMVAFCRWLRQKVTIRRKVSVLRRRWLKQVACHFRRRCTDFRALALTSSVRLGMIQHGFAPECVTVWPHGIEQPGPGSLQISREEAKRRLGLPAESVLLTIFGFVAAYKGQRLAVDALKRLPANYHLAIVGGAHPLAPPDLTLNSVLEAWEGEDPKRLTATGYVSRETIDLWHAATDICLSLHGSEFSSGSASICSALSSGKPVIATNIPAFAEIQRDGDCLLLCTPSAPYELAWNIRRLAEDPQMQERLVQNARSYAARRNWQRMTEMLIDVYREMTDARHAHRTAWDHAVVRQKAA